MKDLSLKPLPGITPSAIHYSKLPSVIYYEDTLPYPLAPALLLLTT